MWLMFSGSSYPSNEVLVSVVQWLQPHLWVLGFFFFFVVSYL